MREPQRAPRLDLLTGIPFLVAVGLLLLNDRVLKAAFPGLLTGKLSDFAGIFALCVFLGAFAPARVRPSAIGIGLAFALWKSPWSQPLIDGWNALGPFRIARVVDATDLVALAILPAACWLVERTPRPRAVRRTHALASAIVALFAFGATSQPAARTPVNESYPFDVGRAELELVMRIAMGEDLYDADADTIGIRFESEGCRYPSALVVTDGDAARSVLLVRALQYGCSEDDTASLLEEFEHDVVARVRRYAQDESIVRIVRDLAARRRAEPLTPEQERGLVVIRVPERVRHGDTLAVTIMNLGDPLAYDLCDLRRERWRDPDWVDQGPAAPECRANLRARRFYPHANRELVLYPAAERWPAGRYRLTHAFRLEGDTFTVRSLPFVVHAD